MTADVKQLGTGLELRAGQFVTVTPATNLPQGGFFVAPADGSWGENSILVDEVDFQSPVTVWVCGRIASSGAWEFQGVFSEEERARSECRDAGYFVAPVEMDRGLPHETTDWPGLYYPLAATATGGGLFPILLSGDPGHAEAMERAKDVLLRKSPGWRMEDCNHTDDHADS